MFVLVALAVAAAVASTVEALVNLKIQLGKKDE